MLCSIMNYTQLLPVFIYTYYFWMLALVSLLYIIILMVFFFLKLELSFCMFSNKIINRGVSITHYYVKKTPKFTKNNLLKIMKIITLNVAFQVIVQVISIVKMIKIITVVTHTIITRLFGYIIIFKTRQFGWSQLRTAALKGSQNNTRPSTAGSGATSLDTANIIASGFSCFFDVINGRD